MMYDKEAHLRDDERTYGCPADWFRRYRDGARHAECRRGVRGIREVAFYGLRRPTLLGHPEQHIPAIGWEPKVGPGDPMFVAVWIGEYDGLPERRKETA